MRNARHTGKSKFTLIELLVVIGIIGILVAILLPAIAGAIKEAKRAKAQADCKLLAQACNAFKSDYQSMPTDRTSGSGAISTVELDMLGGRTGRKKVYYENTGSVKNPWDGTYSIAFDYNGDNDVEAADVAASSTAIAGSVAVWTSVPSSSGSTYATSWDN